MKIKTLLLGIAMLLLLTYQAFAFETQPIAVDSKIEKVTVYRQGAFVARKAVVDIPAGNGSFVVSGEADYVDAKSARLRPNGEFDIISIRHTVDYPPVSQDSEEIISQKAEKVKLESALQESKLDKKVLEAELAFLNGDKLISKENKKMTATEMTALMDFYRDRLKQISRSIMKADKTIATTNEKLENVNIQIRRYKNSIKMVNQFVIETYSTAAMKSEIELSYWTQSASWESLYDIRVKDINDPLIVQSNASVVNATGEDWNQIALTLSTGNPWRSTTMPTINPWLLGFQNQFSPQREPVDRLLSFESSNMRELNDFSSDEVIEMVSENTAPPLPKTKVSENMTTMEFKIAGGRTLLSNSLPNIIKLETNEIKAKFHYEAIPSKSTVAFLKANIQHWRSFNFSYGEAALYFEGTYIGKTILNPNQVNDSLSISFGPDIAVAVSRKKSQDFNERNWIGTKKTETNGYEFEIQNNKSVAIDIRVLDHIPISMNESIVVELLEAEGAEVNKRDGLLTWQIKLASGQKAAHDFAYEVTYPRGQMLAAGR